MSHREPTTSELFATFLAQLESSIGQDSPINDKAFLRVLAIVMAGMAKGNYKLGSDAAQQNLALTASGEGLDRIGNDNNTPRKLAENAILTATLPATTGTIIPSTQDFYSESTGLRYRPTEDVTSVAGVATLSLRCTESGTSGNLEIDDTFYIGSQIAGATTVATVTAVDTLGVDEETDADYRPRVLFAQRAITGGANPSDLKIWAEAVTGVRRAYPYSGRAVIDGESFPGDRTVCIEATTDIDEDGIAPTLLLNSVRAALNIDPETGKSRMPLGLTDDTLFIYSIVRTEINVIIVEFDCSEDSEDDCKSDITDALTLYFLSVRPYVPSVDLIQEKNNVITAVTISEIVQDVLKSYGASANDIRFEVYDGEYFIEQESYTLGDNEKAKLGTVSYE